MSATLADILRCRWHVDWKWLVRPMSSPYRIRTVMEVGIGPEEISMLPYFARPAPIERLVGVDPHPEFAKWAAKVCDDVYEVAVGEKHGEAVLLENGGSSYLSGNWSPTAAPDGSKETKVKVVPFRDLDDERIDILNVDCEGGEWAVFSQMKSNPLLIGVELWAQNPDRARIIEWLVARSYALRFTTGPEGETMIWSRE